MQRVESLRAMQTRENPLNQSSAPSLALKDFLSSDSKTTFDDVVGQADAKAALVESVILPVKFPKLFQSKSSSARVSRPRHFSTIR